MATVSLSTAMPKLVTRKVTRLRWLVRLYVAIEGIAAIILVLGSAFWLGLAIDWLFEPAPALRALLGLIVIAAAAYAASRFLFSRAFRRLPNSSMALLLERNFPELGESLVTTVEAADRGHPSPLGHPEMLQHTGDEAAAVMGRIKLLHIFRFRPLLWKSGLAAALLLSIITLAVSQPDVFGFWVARMRLTDAPWPRRVQLAVLGFDEHQGKRVVNVARDDDFQLQVEASIRDGHVAPEQVKIRYRLADGRRGRDTMTKVGEALPGRDDSQRFRYTFNKVVADLEFDLIGEDDRVRDLGLHVVERPQIVKMLFECEFPEYMQRSPQAIPASGRVELPEGTTAQCRVKANKSLEQVTVHDPASQQDLPATIATETPDSFTFDLEAGAEDRVFLITMLDHDGVKNREPYRVVVSAVPDLPPDVSVQLRGISSAVTPQATIPFFGQISDEYGLEEAWFETQVDQDPPVRRLLSTQLAGRRQLAEIGSLDLAETQQESNSRLITLQPGQQLTLSIKARDAYNLQEEPHLGSSQRFLLDVVTTSQLRALLEKRELGLRQRFEAIYEKMVGTADLLTRIEAAPDEEELQRHQERNRLRLSGSRQNVTQLAHETIGVADGFEEIVRELINNRVDTEELKQRLQQGIADPLREIGTGLMPKLEEILQEFESTFADGSDTKELHAAAVAQAEVVTEAMKQVLDRMLELESYNELVELLRGIVDGQKKLEEKTKQQRREKLRNLLDEE